MSLSDLASLGSFISGFAVLVSLIFLYFQLRQVSAQVLQTEKNQRALMNQGAITRTIELITSNNAPHLNELYTKVIRGDTAYSLQEISLLRLHVRARLYNLQDAYAQHRSGLVDQITFESILVGTRLMLAQPVYRAIWQSGRTTYSSEWMSYIDALVEEIPLAPPVDDIARFNADLVEVMR